MGSYKRMLLHTHRQRETQKTAAAAGGSEREPGVYGRASDLLVSLGIIAGVDGARCSLSVALMCSAR